MAIFTDDFVDEFNYLDYLKSKEPVKEKVDEAHNETLDTDKKYCHVDVLKYIDDDHLLKRMVKQVYPITYMPESSIFFAGLGVYASVACRKWCVAYKSGKRLPIGLYVAIEQPVATGKTNTLSIFQAPFFEVLEDVNTQLSMELAKIEENAMSDKDTIERQKNIKPKLFTSNSTPEALEKSLSRTNGCFSAVSSEQGLINSMLGLSYGNGTSNNDVPLEGFNGGQIDVDRVGREGYSGNVVGGIVCFAQPGTVEKIMAASGGVGVSERFFMLAEPHNLGNRVFGIDTDYDSSLDEEYGALCEFSHDVLLNPVRLRDMTVLEISEAGWGIIYQCRNEIEPHLKDGAKYSHISLRGAAGKIDMQIMKLSANLYLLDGGALRNWPLIPDKYVEQAKNIAVAMLEANLSMCGIKGVIGAKAEFVAILSYFENKPNGEVLRKANNNLIQKKPFSDFTGNKSKLVKQSIADMVTQGLLTVQDRNGSLYYKVK